MNPKLIILKLATIGLFWTTIILLSYFLTLAFDLKGVPAYLFGFVIGVLGTVMSIVMIAVDVNEQ